MERLGVLVAVPDEAKAILADPAFGWEAEAGGLMVSRRLPVLLRVSGIGKAFASWACAELAARCGLLAGLGTSGGLGDEPVGSLWLCRDFVERDMDASALGFAAGITPWSGMEVPLMRSASDGTMALARAALADAGLAAGDCVTASADSFVADPGAARSIARATGARLCDMESAAVAKLCLRRSVGAGGGPLEFFALRSVSDNADRDARRSWAESVGLAALDFDRFLLALATRLARTGG